MKIRKLIKTILFVFLLTILSSSLIFAEKTVSLATLEWEPYIGSELKNKGYVHEIVTQAFKRVGYKTDIVFYPWARAVAATESGAKDGLFPEYYDEKRKKHYIFSDSFPGGPVGLYKRKSLKISYPVDPLKDQTEALRGLSKFKFGVVRGYINTAEFDAASFLEKEQVKDDETNLKKLFRNRIQLIFIDKFVAKHIIMKKLPHYMDEFEFMEPPLEIKDLYIAFSKKAIHSKQKLKDFNIGLKQIKEDGTMSEIMFDHGF